MGVRAHDRDPGDRRGVGGSPQSSCYLVNGGPQEMQLDPGSKTKSHSFEFVVILVRQF